jgi:hypothetical protein
MTHSLVHPEADNDLVQPDRPGLAEAIHACLSERQGDVIWVDDDESPIAPPAGARVLGYDIGYLERVWGGYSVIVNEIMFGWVAELREKHVLLNDHGLFERAGAEYYLEYRARLPSRFEYEAGVMTPVRVCGQPRLAYDPDALGLMAP